MGAARPFTGTDPESGKTYDVEDDIAVVADPGLEADAVVSAAAALDAWLWRRGDDAAIEVAGDRATYDRFRSRRPADQLSLGASRRLSSQPTTCDGCGRLRAATTERR